MPRCPCGGDRGGQGRRWSGLHGQGPRLATQAAIAIENARLFAATARQVRELGTLREIGQAITGRLELSAVLEAVVAGALRLLGSQRAQILLWDEATQTLRYGAAVGPEADRVRVQVFELGRGINGTVAQTRQPMILDDYQASPYALPEFPDIVATITVPILFEDRLLGVLHSHTTEPGRRFTPDDLRRFQMLATQAAIAIENARLHKMALDRAQQLATLNELTRMLTTALDPQAVGRKILAAAQVLIPGAVGRLWWRVEPDGALDLVSSVGLREPEGGHTLRLRPGEWLIGIAVATRQPVISQEVTQDPRFINKEWAAVEGLVSCIVLPLVWGDQVNGGLAIFTREPHVFTDGEVGLLRSFADEAAIALENARLYEQIRRHAAELDDRVKARTAELEEALRVKAQFLANMSHELRTPLNAVLGFSEVLLGRSPGDITPKQERYLRQIQAGGQRLLTLVTDLLEMTGTEGLPSFHFDRVAVQDLVGEVLEPLAGAARAKQVEMETHLDLGLPIVVADRRKLAQILHHLVTNAIRFTPAGGRVTVTTRRVLRDAEYRGTGESESRDAEVQGGTGEPERGGTGAPEERETEESSAPAPRLPGSPIQVEGKWVEIVVEDTGIGIKREDLERIFRGFEQVDSSDSRQYGGAGLGLALVRRLAELHGGRVWAESDGEGHGARFMVRLPLLVAPPAPRVLVVEDEEPVLEAICATLAAAGYLVDRARTGAEALDRLATTPPSLLVLDIGLPDVDGWEVLKQVRREEQTRTLPVLVLTGLQHVHAEEALARGADEFLAKPVSAQVLVETVGRLLRRPAAAAPALEERPPMSKEE